MCIEESSPHLVSEITIKRREAGSVHSGLVLQDLARGNRVTILSLRRINARGWRRRVSRRHQKSNCFSINRMLLT